MQRRGIEQSACFDLKTIATSEIDHYALTSYAAVHCGLNDDLIEEYDYPPVDKMIKEFSDMNIGYDFKKKKEKDWTKYRTGKRLKELKKYYLASVLQNNLGDISRVSELPYADLWFYSFPCTDVSIAGEQKGLSKKSNTRSGLLWEVERLLKTSISQNRNPDYLCMENVKNLVGKNHINDFKLWLKTLDDCGYNTYYSVINAKNCGIPQNRERVFAISIKKEIDLGNFTFPKPFDNGLRLLNFLEDTVDDKYYISEERAKNFKCTDQTFTKNIIGTIKEKQKSIGQRDNIYNPAGFISTLLSTDYKGAKMTPCIVNGNANKLIKEYELSGGKWDKKFDHQKRCYSIYGISPTLITYSGVGHVAKIVEGSINNNVVIRTLTPKEYFLLMGFTETDFDTVKRIGLSDTQLYKIAGNGIVTNCVQLLFEHLYQSQFNNKYICTDDNFE